MFTHPDLEEPVGVLVVGEQGRVLPVCCRAVIWVESTTRLTDTRSIPPASQSIAHACLTLVDVDRRHLAHVPNGTAALASPAPPRRRRVILLSLLSRRRRLGREACRCRRCCCCCYWLLRSQSPCCWYYAAAAAAAAAACCWWWGAKGMMMTSINRSSDIRTAGIDEPPRNSDAYLLPRSSDSPGGGVRGPSFAGASLGCLSGVWCGVAEGNVCVSSVS